MATYNFDKSPRPCPVAALADEARLLINALEDVDAVPDPEEPIQNKLHRDKLMNTTTDYLAAVVDRASRLDADSAKGALFQICAITHFLNDLDDVIISKLDARTPPASKAILRLLHSIAAYIEKTTPARLNDACGDWYMLRTVSENGCLDEALEISKRVRERANASH